MYFPQKKGFTLVEIIMVCVILAVGFMGVLVALQNGMGFVQKTREKIIATNLAREGIEAIYQIRDTNRRKRAGKKEQCWLKTNPVQDTNAAGCEDDDWMQSGNYILQTQQDQGQQFFFLSGGNNLANIDLTDENVDSIDMQYSLCNTGNTRYACPGNTPDSKEGKYFRQIKGLGLFKKDSNNIGGDQLNCSNGSDQNNCGNSDAKEYRFCSEVSYIGKGRGTISICGLITNFQK